MSSYVVTFRALYQGEIVEYVSSRVDTIADANACVCVILGQHFRFIGLADCSVRVYEINATTLVAEYLYVYERDAATLVAEYPYPPRN